MTYTEIFLTYGISYILCFLVLSLLRGRFCWQDALFITVVYTTLNMVSTAHMNNSVVCTLLSVVLTVVLFFKVYMPIACPQKEVENESTNSYR